MSIQFISGTAQSNLKHDLKLKHSFTIEQINYNYFAFRFFLTFPLQMFPAFSQKLNLRYIVTKLYRLSLIFYLLKNSLWYTNLKLRLENTHGKFSVI